MRLIPVFGSGLGGGGGGGAAGTEEDDAGGRAVYGGGGTELKAAFKSWNVRRAVRMTISRPLRSLMSKLSQRSIHAARNGEDESGRDAPVDVVVKDLDVTRLKLAWRFLRLRYKHRGVGLAEDEAFFALPLKLMPGGMKVHD